MFNTACDVISPRVWFNEPCNIDLGKAMVFTDEAIYSDSKVLIALLRRRQNFGAGLDAGMRAIPSGS